MVATISAAAILCHTTAFLSDVVSQCELRRNLISTLHRSTTPISDHQTAVKLAADTLEAGISFSTSPAARSVSLFLAEKLLLPLPRHPLSSFLLSLIHTLSNRHIDAAIPLLRIFHSIPSLARSEIAPVLFDRLFFLHLVPVSRCYDERRARILSSNSSTCETRSLSKMNEEQASKLRELEREYEEVLDENCRVVAVYLEKVLVSENGDTLISPPLLIMRSFREGDGTESSDEEKEEEEKMEETETPVLKNGRYNPIWTERETSLEFLSISSSGSSSYAPLYPQRVSPIVFKPQQSLENLTASVYLSSAAEPDSSLDEKNLPSSSSESEAESEVIDTTKRKTNPMRTENKSNENKSLYAPLYPVSTKILKPQNPSENWTAPDFLNSAAEPESSLDDNLPCSSLDYAAEREEKDEKRELLEPRQSQIQESMQTIFTESIYSPDYPMADYLSPLHGSYKQAPPKDFLCPITSDLFDDPVTLETGQTYERGAIEEWFNMVDSTCPITPYNSPEAAEDSPA